MLQSCRRLHHNGNAEATISHNDIMNLDNERVKYIHSRLSKNLGRENSVKELDSTTLPTKSDSHFGSGNYFVVVGLGTPKRDLSLIFYTEDVLGISLVLCDAFESAMRRRIMKFLNISDNDYMVFTANRTSAFKLVADSYPFQSSKKLLTVYDYENEAVEAMISCSEKRGAKAHNSTCKTKRRCLDQVDSLGLIMITNRTRYLINWLVNSMMKLKHPNAEGVPLVKIYGPKVKFDRGPALAFNVFDWKDEKVEPVLVQKLADRNNISLSYGFLHHVWFVDKYAEDNGKVLQTKEGRVQGVTTNKKKDRDELGVTVVTAALSFLANFEDVYKLWTFVVRFLDADFVEKERWRYTTLNQKTIEV
ncbi:Aspartyl protease family protein [Glycine soja]|uniref:Aspartyl protease family protein n=1 Tax=Glycine soja TaxID=3848 RepID=A0A445GHG6_GLYSO|nr:Aspartyl protease family protein [Glycine soja]